jgi:hypothetical protein
MMPMLTQPMVIQTEVPVGMKEGGETMTQELKMMGEKVDVGVAA